MQVYIFSLLISFFLLKVDPPLLYRKTNLPRFQGSTLTLFYSIYYIFSRQLYLLHPISNLHLFIEVFYINLISLNRDFQYYASQDR